MVVGRCRPIRKWSHYTTRVDEEDEENRYIWISGHTMSDQIVKKSYREVFYSGLYKGQVFSEGQRFFAEKVKVL